MEPRFELIHSVPGRLRIKSLDLWGNTELTEQIREVLMEVPGVEDVKVNGVTGTVNVEFDPDSEPVVVAAVRQQLPEEALVDERHDERALVAAESVDVEPMVRTRPSRDQARARAMAKRRFAVGVAAAAFVAGFVARHLLTRR